MNILVLEASTSSAKAMVYAVSRQVLALRTIEYPANISDGAEQDAEGVLHAVLALGQEISRGYSIDAIALCGAWHSLLVCDEKMRPVGKVLSWQYMGAAETAKSIRSNKALSDELYYDTGCMVHAIYPVYKMAYLREQGLDTGNIHVCGQSSYIFWRLTGKRWTTACMASGSAFLNSGEQDYNQRSLEIAGIAKGQLGEIHEPSETAPLEKEFASLLGVKAGIPVILPCADGALNQIGSLAGENDMTLSVGTSAALRLNIRSGELVNERKTTWKYLSPHSWMIGAATSGAANCVNWFRQNLAGNTLSFSDLETESIIEADRPIFMPFLFGERCPGWNDDKNAVFHGVRPQHTLFSLYGSLLEGVLFNIYQCYLEICLASRQPERILISGGILKSALWLQMAADIIGMPLTCDITDQSSMMGAAYFAEEILTGYRITSGEHGHIILPDAQKNTYYKERYDYYLEYYYYGERQGL